MTKPLAEFVKARNAKKTVFEKIKYEILKYGTFLTPPAIFYLIGYAIFKNHLLAFFSMVFLLFIMVVIIFIWYARKENLFAKF